MGERRGGKKRFDGDNDGISLIAVYRYICINEGGERKKVAVSS
jgi:hypothetical protein